MAVIFGFGPGNPEDLGEVALCVCPNCHNQVFLHHVRSKKSVRLYFVPVVPYGTDDYLICPVCSRGLQITCAQLRYIHSMSGATASFRAGRLTQARYMAQVERFWRQLGVNPAGHQPLTPAGPGASAAAQLTLHELSEGRCPAARRPKIIKSRSGPAAAINRVASPSGNSALSAPDAARTP